MRKLILIAALALLLPATARAMSVADVVKLNQSQVGDEVILSQIETSGTIFTLTVEDILELKSAGVSDRVITYMINTGKHQKSDVGGGTGSAEQQETVEAQNVESYHGDLDSYYRGYNDANFGLYFSWGWGGYYYPYSYWPYYGYYYYPSYYCGYYPYYGHHYYGDHYYHDTYYKDGRHYGDRGSPDAPGGELFA